MKKTMIIAFAVLMIALTAGFVCAIGDSTVDINLSGTKEIAPNAFQLTFGVENENADAQKAISENKKTSDNLYNALKSLINTSKGDYIKTSDYSVTPNYEYNKNKKTLKGYTVNNSVIVYSKDVMLVSKYIDVAANNGVTQVDNLIFKSTNYENDCNALLAELTKKAQKRANDSVKPINMQVLALKALSTSCSDSSISPMVNYAMRNTKVAGDALTMESSTPIEAGKTILRANINASFYVGKIK